MDEIEDWRMEECWMKRVNGEVVDVRVVGEEGGWRSGEWRSGG